MFLSRIAAWLNCNIAGCTENKNEVVLFCGHCEKVGFFGKDYSAGENGTRKEKRKTKPEMDGLHERSHRHELQELSRAVRALCTSPIGRFARN